MKIRNRSFPYPVLASFRDDIAPNNFALNVKVRPDIDNYYFDLELVYDNSTISCLVDEKKAEHVVHVECKRNFYREVHNSPKSKFRISIPSSELVGRVEITAFIIASSNIENYSPEGLHNDYNYSKFELELGDILGVARTVTFDAFVDYDPLKSITSILTIEESEVDQDGAMIVNLDSDQIVAILSKNDFKDYKDLRIDPQLRSLVVNQVGFPSLIAAIAEIQKTSQDEFDIEMKKKWFRSIYKKLLDENIDLRKPDISPVMAAQNILKQPIRRSFDKLSSFLEVE